MALMKTVARRAQILLRAAYGADSSYADYDYIINYINIVNTDLNNRFQALGLNYDTQVVEVIGVPANTINLAAYQADGGPLANLVTPDSTDGSSPVEWRLSGQNDTDWMPVTMSGKVYDTNVAGAGQLPVSDAAIVESFEFRAGVIWISPCSQIVDLRVRGDFLPNFAGDDAAQLLAAGSLNVLMYWTCERISKYGPGGESGPVHEGFKEDAQKAEDDFVCLLAKSQMGENVRLGGRRTQCFGNAGGFTPPIV
jgi:hypothetical protein